MGLTLTVLVVWRLGERNETQRSWVRSSVRLGMSTADRSHNLKEDKESIHSRDCDRF